MAGAGPDRDRAAPSPTPPHDSADRAAARPSGRGARPSGSVPIPLRGTSEDTMELDNGPRGLHDHPVDRDAPDGPMAAAPGDAGALLARGAARRDAGDLDGAIADLDRAIELEPRLVAALNDRGVARFARGDLAGAVADFDRVLALEPRHAEAYLNRGVARHVRGDIAAAIADLHRALELRPGWAEAYYNRGVARLADGDPAGAIVDLDEALRIDPRHVSAYIARGNARYHRR